MTDILNDPYLHLIFIGFCAGISAVVLSWFWALTPLRPPPAALFISIAFLTSLSFIHKAPIFLWIGTLVLTASGWISERIPRFRFTVRILLIAAGAALLAFLSYESKTSLLEHFSFVAIVAFSCLLYPFNLKFESSRMIPLILVASAGGILIIVPDTEGPFLLFGISIAALLFAVKRVPFFGASGAAAFAGTAMWMVFESGKGRLASIVVAVACFGILLTFPLTSAVVPWRRSIVSGFLWFLLHCLSISLVIDHVRTTPNVTRAVIVSGYALLIPFVAGLLKRIDPLERNFDSKK